MTGRGSSPIGTQPLRTGKPWRVKRGFGGQTENIAGGLFAMYRCAMKPESSSDGMEPLSTSKIARDRKSTRLNSSHTVISYAVFCLKKKKKKTQRIEYNIQTNHNST